MDYEVILTIPAKTQLDHIIEYVLSKYENTQAALSIIAMTLGNSKPLTP